jgi:hypothetical protein
MCTFINMHIILQEVGALGEVLPAHGPRPGDHGQARQGEQRRPRGGPSQVSVPTHHKQSQSIAVHFSLEKSFFRLSCRQNKLLSWIKTNKVYAYDGITIDKNTFDSWCYKFTSSSERKTIEDVFSTKYGSLMWTKRKGENRWRNSGISRQSWESVNELCLHMHALDHLQILTRPSITLLPTQVSWFTHKSKYWQLAVLSALARCVHFFSASFQGWHQV